MPNKLNDQFTSIIKARIERYSTGNQQYEEGKVISVSDGIVIATGLNNIMLNEMVEFENGSYGLALNLESDAVGIVMLGKYDDIKENSAVRRTNKLLSVGVGDEVLGRIVNPLGEAIDGKGAIKYKDFAPIEKIASGVMTRQSVYQPLATGILAIDSMFPIGRGQRELIIGDRQTGKTTIAIDTIINQKGKNVKCVYVAIGQKNSSIASLALMLETYGAMKYTTIVSSTASDIPALKYIAPYAGMTIAEEWCKKGQDVLIIFDDLSKHAVSYRTLSLLLRRPPGREAYPGDIFYLHSRLLERACKLNKENGGGSITALPIVETQAGDISAYIPTNVISITDGQLFMISSMFNEGQRPAIGVGLSVSRVGSAAQIKAIKQMSSSLKLDLAQYEELSTFSQFGSELDESTKVILEHGKRIMTLLKQAQEVLYDQIDQAALLFLVKTHLIKWIPVDKITNFKEFFLKNIHNTNSYKTLKEKQAFDDALTDKFGADCKKIVKNYILGIKGYEYSKVGDISELNITVAETNKQENTIEAEPSSSHSSIQPEASKKVKK